MAGFGRTGHGGRSVPRPVLGRPLIVLPPLARAAGLLVFGILTLAAAVPLLMLRVPSEADGLRRLDRTSGEAHRPATAIGDEIAANSHDPVAQALWRAHVERALLSASKLKAGWPSPRLSLRDPMALRALTLILVAASFFAAGGERVKQVTAAFDWSGVVAPANFRIDAWVTPPVYTGRPPVMLPGLRPGDTAQAIAPVTVPAGSLVVIRATGKVNFEIVQRRRRGCAADVRASVPAGTEERRLVIKDDGSASVHGVLGTDLTWNFIAVPDRAPTIELIRIRSGRRAARCGSIIKWTTTMVSSTRRPSSRSRTRRRLTDRGVSCSKRRTSR